MFLNRPCLCMVVCLKPQPVCALGCSSASIGSVSVSHMPQMCLHCGWECGFVSVCVCVCVCAHVYPHLSDHSPSPCTARSGLPILTHLSTRRHCCCTLASESAPQLHTQETRLLPKRCHFRNTHSRLLALSPSRPQPIAMTTEKRIEYK